MQARVARILALSASVSTPLETVQEAQSLEEQSTALSSRDGGATALKPQEDGVHIPSLAALPESRWCLSHRVLGTPLQIVLNSLEPESLKVAWRSKVEGSQVLHEDLLGFSEMAKLQPHTKGRIHVASILVLHSHVSGD